MIAMREKTMNANSDQSAAPPRRVCLIIAYVLVGIGLSLLATSIVNGEWSAGLAPFPYVWRDVAIVHLACAAPLAWWLSRAVCSRVPSGWALSISVAAFSMSFLSAGADVSPTSEVGAIAMRLSMAFGFAFSLFLVANVMNGFEGDIGQAIDWRHHFMMSIFGLAALILPVIYVNARCRHDLSRFGEYLEQSRFGEAGRLGKGILAVCPEVHWQGQPLAKAAVNLNNVLRNLERSVATPLPGDANASVRLQRAQQLAMLGRTKEALAVLPTFDDPLLPADAANLAGTIHEACGEWERAMTSFQRARAACQTGADSPDRRVLLVRATMGVAYNQRKSGDYVAAEKAYQELLAIAPNADSHFLLAQFYEDAQNASMARYHAKQAMSLNPVRYQRDGEKLIRKLAVFHFGCLRMLAE
jgi:Flp pilus assembly protein TadD